MLRHRLKMLKEWVTEAPLVLDQDVRGYSCRGGLRRCWGSPKQAFYA